MADLADLLRSGDKNAVVSDIYQNVLGRQADPTAYAWANNLDVNDPSSILNLSRRIAQSEEGKNYAKGNQGQYNYIAGLSQSDNPLQNPVYSNMEYLGSYNYKDPSGGVVTTDEMGNPVSYSPSVSWYDQQLAKHPDALRATDYRNQTYLAGGPLDKTYNFNGTDIPIQAAEYQIDPKTGKFITDQNGNYKPVEFRPQGYNMWDDWAAPVAAVAIPALAAGAVYAAPYLAGEGALTTGMVDASGNIIGAGTEGAAYGAGAGTTVTGASQWTPEIIAQANASGDPIGYISSLSDLTPAEITAYTTPATGGLSALQKAQLLRMGTNALGNMFGGGQNTVGAGTGGGSAGGYNYASLPFLANPQQNTTFMKTGPDVSGSGITTAGMPVQLDTTRHNLLMANLLRG